MADDDSRFSMLEIDTDDPPAVEAPRPVKPAAAAAAPEPPRGVCTRCKVNGPLVVGKTVCPVCERIERPRETTASNTPQGMAMSPRMDRIYGWLRANGCQLTPFSTDSQVASMLPRLTTLRASLDSPNTHALNGQIWTDAQRAEVRTDLEAIMRRVPSARVAATGRATTEDAPAETKPEQVTVRKLVAVDQLSATGTLTYWHLPGAIEEGKLQKAWEAEGLDVEPPCIPSPTVALQRACKEQASKTLLLRAHSEGGWVLANLRDKIDGEKAQGATLDKLIEKHGVRVRLSEALPGDEPKILVTPPGGKNASEEVKEAARIIGAKARADYNKARAEVASTDVSGWLVDFVYTLGGVALRESGGFYFVPKKTEEQLLKVKRALAAVSGHTVYDIPIMEGSGTARAVLDGLREEVTDKIRKVEAELTDGDGMGARAARNRQDEIAALRDKIRSYEVLFKMELGVTATLDALSVKLAAQTTRGSQLEID